MLAKWVRKVGSHFNLKMSFKLWDPWSISTWICLVIQ